MFACWSVFFLFLFSLKLNFSHEIICKDNNSKEKNLANSYTKFKNINFNNDFDNDFLNLSNTKFFKMSAFNVQDLSLSRRIKC